MTVREIAAGADVSTSLLYFYFDSKDAVILTTLRSIANELDGLLLETADLVRTVQTVHQFFSDRPGFPRILAWILLEGGDFALLKDDPILTRFKSGFSSLGVPEPLTSAGVVVTMLLGNALLQSGVNTGIERDPEDTQSGQALNRSIVGYIEACGNRNRE